jgi:predicted DNA-binding transcriptional regulator AlpA
LEKLISYAELATLGISYTRVHLSRLERLGQFPRAIWLGPNRKFWFASDVERYLAQRPTERPPLKPLHPEIPPKPKGRKRGSRLVDGKVVLPEPALAALGADG